MAEVAASKSMGASCRAGAASAMGLVPRSGLAAKVGVQAAAVKHRYHVLCAACMAKMADGAKCPLLCVTTPPHGTRLVDGQPHRPAPDDAGRFSASITADDASLEPPAG
jgi:hypothetical protein